MGHASAEQQGSAKLVTISEEVVSRWPAGLDELSVSDVARPSGAKVLLVA